MFENFTSLESIVLGLSILMNIVLIICIVVLTSKKHASKSVLDTFDEVKVTKVTEEKPEPTSFDTIVQELQKGIENASTTAENAVELFEQEQEEKAIISYQELLNTKAKPESIEVKTKEVSEDLNEPLKQNVDASSTDDLKPSENTNYKKSNFTHSDFVSPVFGKIDENINTNVNTNIQITENDSYDNHALEKTLNIEPLTDEIKKNSEFLSALKEFRRNL